MKNFFLFVNLIFAMFLLGCVTVPPHEEMQKIVKDFRLPVATPKDKALVYVVRPDSVGALIKFNIFLDDKNPDSEMGYTKGGEYIFFYAKPGKHRIYSNAETDAEIEIEAKSSQVIFIKQIPSMGILMARNELKILDEVEGKWSLSKTSPGTVKKTDK